MVRLARTAARCVALVLGAGLGLIALPASAANPTYDQAVASADLWLAQQVDYWRSSPYYCSGPLTCSYIGAGDGHKSISGYFVNARAKVVWSGNGYSNAVTHASEQFAFTQSCDPSQAAFDVVVRQSLSRDAAGNAIWSGPSCYGACKINTSDGVAGPGWQLYKAQYTGESCAVAPPVQPDRNPPPPGQYSNLDSSGNICASIGGTVVCVPRITPACASGGGGTLCAGSPPPAPPAPPLGQPQPQPTYPEPGQQPDNYESQTGGGSLNQTVIIYAPAPSPGQQAGNEGAGSATPNPSYAASTNAPSGNAAVSGTCLAAPPCTGDSVQCAQLAQIWRTGCMQLDRSTQVFGDGNPAHLPAVDDANGLPVTEVDLSGAAVDASGWGFGSSCPLHDETYTVAGHAVAVPWSSPCSLLSLLGFAVLLVAGFVSARIITGST